MSTSWVLFVTTFAVCQCTGQDIILQQECSGISTASSRLSVSINSKRNDTGDWVTSFSATKNSSQSSKNLNLDVTHIVVDCQGNQIIHIQGTVREHSPEAHKQSLLFHKKCSRNAAITNNGRTVQKFKSGTWMSYHTQLYHNGSLVSHDYLKTNLMDIQVGGRVGVMKSSFGTRHFHLNGVDQGPAASNIHYPVYGVFELFGDALQATIVESQLIHPNL